MKWSLRFISICMNNTKITAERKNSLDSYNSTFESENSNMATDKYNKVDNIYDQIYSKEYNLFTASRQKKNWKFNNGIPKIKIPTISKDLHSVSKDNMKFFVIEPKYEKKIFKIHKSIRKKNSYMNYPFYQQHSKIIQISDFSSPMKNQRIIQI